METRKRTGGRRRVLMLLSCILLLCVLFCWYLNVQIRPALRDMALVRVNALTSDAMYSTVLDCLNGDKEWAPFVDTSFEGGQVYYVEMNNKELTLFASECAQVAQARLEEKGKQGLTIPLGSVSGASFFAGWGPDIRLSFSPEINAQAYFYSEFNAAGINQTIHRVMLKLEAQMAVVLPGGSEIVYSCVDVPVAEHIIVGNVPEFYADMGAVSSPLNLIPKQ
ncbi:sporulation protein YunB [Eubacteriales bacterium OttesenSCG-928-K08]|nr:sporulation protein YunB [Eubacteriales bacterium OttesenSCG-928-K08]